MPIKKLTKSKRLSRTKRLTKSKKLARRQRLSRTNKKHVMKRKVVRKTQRGGFSSDCSIATVKERGFNLPALGSGTTQIPGLSILDTTAMIFNPNCSGNTNSYQAMVQ